MANPRIAVIYDGTGNVRSVAKAFERIGYPPVVTADPNVVRNADAVILPGQGAAGNLMTSLTNRKLKDILIRRISDDQPFFGVCLGLQLLLERTEEDEAACLGILPGTVRRFGDALKVPHMGWNQVRITAEHPVLSGVPDQSHFYFVHSYYADPTDRSAVAGVTDYGVSFCSIIAKGNLVATQFHPEKSGDVGLRLYENFVRKIVLASG